MTGVTPGLDQPGPLAAMLQDGQAVLAQAIHHPRPDAVIPTPAIADTNNQ